jgi:hypothetical protein
MDHPLRGVKDMVNRSLKELSCSAWDIHLAHVHFGKDGHCAIGYSGKTLLKS